MSAKKRGWKLEAGGWNFTESTLWVDNEALKRPAVDVPAVLNFQNPHFLANHLVQDTVIPNSKFPITLELMAKRLTIVRGLSREPLFNGPTNPSLEITVDGGQIFSDDGRMVDELVAHHRRRFLRWLQTCSCVNALLRTKVAARACACCAR